MDWTGKKIRLIFIDFERTGSKIGEVQNVTAEFVTIKTERGVEYIPMLKVIRLEEL